MVDEPLMRAISEKTNLSIETVRELLERGWSYEEMLDAPPRWIHPVVKLKSIRRAVPETKTFDESLKDQLVSVCVELTDAIEVILREYPDAYKMRYHNGDYILHPLLAGKAQALAALANLSREEDRG